jgi:hypothetical protein
VGRGEWHHHQDCEPMTDVGKWRAATASSE